MARWAKDPFIADRDEWKPHRFNLRSLMAQFFNR
jgi:hypothetical protein